MEPLPKQLGWWKCPKCARLVIKEIASSKQPSCLYVSGGGCGKQSYKSTWIEHNGQTPEEL